MTRTSTLLLVLLIAAAPTVADAAVLHVSPLSPIACENGTFAVEVKLDTEGEAINAIQLQMNFSAGSLQVTDLSVSGSLFRFWAEGPEYSNIAGTILMTGGLPTPGFNGSNGHVARITFRPIGSGGTLTFNSSTQVLLNDGFGTATDLALVNMNPLTVLLATNPSCAASTPTPGVAGTPGPTPTPLVCPEVQVCHGTGEGGSIERLRECEVHVECSSAPSRTTQVLMAADDPTACPIVAQCAEDTEAVGGTLGEVVGVLENLATDPIGTIQAVARRGQFWMGIALGLLAALLILLVAYLIRRLTKKLQNQPPQPSRPPIPQK